MRNPSENSKERPEGLEGPEGTPQLLRLDVRKAAPLPPSFFQCPISLEVMRSPVSLCTGVTYDRASIQRWLDCGNTTCPATMQPLPSTDLVPNLTLRRLIQLWFTSASDHAPSLSDVARALSDPSYDDAYKLRLLSSDALHPSSLASLFSSHETRELAVTLVSLILSLDLVDTEHKRALVSALLSDLDATFSGLLDLLKGADYMSSRIAAAIVLESTLSLATPFKARTMIAETPDLIAELGRLISESDMEAVDAGLRCLLVLMGEDSPISCSSSSSHSLGRRVRAEIVRAGAVSTLVNVVATIGNEMPVAVSERALRVMEAVAEFAEGRTAFCAEAGRCVSAVVGRMMKVGNEGREAAVGFLWSLCCAGGGDLRAREAAATEKGFIAKMLVVMQGVCSPSAKVMAGDLLRVFRASPNSSFASTGYDSKTMHIMPF